MSYCCDSRTSGGEKELTRKPLLSRPSITLCCPVRKTQRLFEGTMRPNMIENEAQNAIKRVTYHKEVTRQVRRSKANGVQEL
ncbi:hypothetical protein PGTUg99_029502 [Puccinia graminis f. sp. tritici]|uniref:Uncharacterized protein n=1 Tax=Puccinia graminis f. sp. tritici TaxID=56615 RepID=A0A5B0MZE6_PUCGR|nr:hypothetical protein PGTUg99_029502 [Puccinia graminis f. sp. tritici]